MCLWVGADRDWFPWEGGGTTGGSQFLPKWTASQAFSSPSRRKNAARCEFRIGQCLAIYTAAVHRAELRKAVHKPDKPVAGDVVSDSERHRSMNACRRRDEAEIQVRSPATNELCQRVAGATSVGPAKSAVACIQK